MPPAEARKLLLKRVQSDNNEIKETDKRIKQLRRLMDNYEKDLKDLTADTKESENEEPEWN